MPNDRRTLDTSYLTLRRWIGILGMTLPAVVYFGAFFAGDFALHSSISLYYYTNVRDYFVGCLCVLSLFLITYDAYSKFDRWITTVGGICALGVALFPTRPQGDAHVAYLFAFVPQDVTGVLHYLCAGTLFVIFAIISLFLFTKTDSPNPTRRKKIRNAIYVACGLLIVAAILGCLVYFFLWRDVLPKGSNAVFWFEALALVAFGTSWLVKGNTLFRD